MKQLSSVNKLKGILVENDRLQPRYNFAELHAKITPFVKEKEECMAVTKQIEPKRA
jgi:hypothetical protein